MEYIEDENCTEVQYFDPLALYEGDEEAREDFYRNLLF